MNKKNYICDCGGTMEEKRVTKNVPIAGQKITLQNVKAKVCRNCGATYFDGKMLLEIENTLEKKSIQTV